MVTVYAKRLPGSTYKPFCRAVFKVLAIIAFILAIAQPRITLSRAKVRQLYQPP